MASTQSPSWTKYEADQSFLYLDSAATTPVAPEIATLMSNYLDHRQGESEYAGSFANPSSAYGIGTAAGGVLREARNTLATVLGAKTSEIVFTSGGTESINAALKGAALSAVRASRETGCELRNHIMISAFEHPAVKESAMWLVELLGFELTVLPVGADGLVKVSDVQGGLTPRTCFVSVMTVNNEVGTIQPIAEIAHVIATANESRSDPVVFHTDAVQAGNAVHLSQLWDAGVHLMSMSGHKFYGPKGVGFLIVRDGVKLESLNSGGGQEGGKRGGTENLAGIVGAVAAFERAQSRVDEFQSTTSALRAYLLEKAKSRPALANVGVNGSLESRIGNNVNLQVPGMDSRKMVAALAKHGIFVSAGAACHEGPSSDGAPVKPSAVLTALGMNPTEAASSFRVTLGLSTTEADIDRFVATLEAELPSCQF